MAQCLDYRLIVAHKKFFNINGVNSLSECFFITRLYDLAKRSKFEEFCRTDKELSEDLHISDHSVKRMKKKFKSFSFIKITRKGIPAKTYYKINKDQLMEAINA